MCDLALAAGLALSAAGAGVNSMESNSNERRQIEARNSAAEAEMLRQRRFADESQGTFRRSVDEQGPGADATRRTEAQGTRREFMAANAAPATNTGAPIAASAPPVVQSEIGRKVGQAIKGAARGGDRLANLSGYDDAALGGRFAMARANSELADTSSKAAGSAALLPLDLAAAENNSYREPSGIGDLLGLVGKGLTLGGATGWSPFGGGTGAVSAASVPGRLAARNPFWQFGASER